uniref:Secreted protein n=1 Tax=Oryza glumipatula TaxID=40148 RepID=A0A0D9YP88_9ORYZ
MALLPLRRLHRLLAVVRLAVALWLAVDGSHTPLHGRAGARSRCRRSARRRVAFGHRHLPDSLS